MAVFEPWATTKPKCSFCGTVDPQGGLVTYQKLCLDCFRKQQEQKSIEDRLLDLEVGLYHAQRHQHVENMRF